MADTVINSHPPAVYGRTAGGAEAARDEWWRNMDNNDGQRQQVGSAVNYANGQFANPDNVGAEENGQLASNEASGAGGHQEGAIGLAGTLARGQQPSHAAYQLQSGLNQATAQQKAFSAGARGSAAIATAGADSRANVSNLQQNAYSQGGMLKSQDMAAGRGMLGSQLNQRQVQNTQRVGQANDFGMENANLQDKWQLGAGHAGVELGGVANGQDNQDLGIYNQGTGPIDAQTDANQAAKNWNLDKQKMAVSANKQDHAKPWET